MNVFEIFKTTEIWLLQKGGGLVCYVKKSRRWVLIYAMILDQKDVLVRQKSSKKQNEENRLAHTEDGYPENVLLPGN
jgi:hypothetical protein